MLAGTESDGRIFRNSRIEPPESEVEGAGKVTQARYGPSKIPAGELLLQKIITVASSASQSNTMSTKRAGWVLTQAGGFLSLVWRVR